FLVRPPPRRSTLFPYTTLFRSAAHAASIKPIVCVGETLEQREGGRTEEVVATQVRASLAGLSREQLAETIVAYEPVWAIGTGRKDRKSTRLNSSHSQISYAVFC